MTSITPKLISHLIASQIQLSRYDNPQLSPTNLGKNIAAIIPHKNNKSNNSQYCIICYDSKTRDVLLTIPITIQFNLKVSTENSITFNDPKSLILYCIKFINHKSLQNFITFICMAKITKVNINHPLIIQDLNCIQQQNYNFTINDLNYDSISDIVIYLHIWLASTVEHPYKRSKMIYKSTEKRINLKTKQERDKVMPALIYALKGMCIGCHRLIITPSKYAFGSNGNKKLCVPSNSTLIMQIELKSIQMKQNTDQNFGERNKSKNTNHQRRRHRKHTKKDYDHKNEYEYKIENEKLRANIVQLQKTIGQKNITIEELLKDNQRLRDTYECTKAYEMNAKNIIGNKMKQKISKSMKYGFGGHIANVVKHKRKIESFASHLSSNPNIYCDTYEGCDVNDDWNSKSFYEWNSENIIDWILALNCGMFAKYAKNIRLKILDANLKGNSMSKISLDEWKDFGIIDFDDRCTIVDHIRTLTMKNQVGNKNNIERYADNFDPLNVVF